MQNTKQDAEARAQQDAERGAQDPRTTGAVIVPIYQTSTFATDEGGSSRAGYDYDAQIPPPAGTAQAG